MKKLIITAVAAGALAATVPTAAHATYTAQFSIKNRAVSTTGAIFHRVNDGQMLAPAIIKEPGQARQTVSIRKVNPSSREPYGIIVWQPAGTCLKVYGRRAFGIYVRTHKYWPQSYGRDVWVSKGVAADFASRVKIRPGREC